MAAQELPPRPRIDQLKHRAKDLLHAARSGDRSARDRFRVLPGFSPGARDRLDRARLALHDAQSVIAREYGFASWKLLSAHVEKVSLGELDAARELVMAATDGRSDRADRLLQVHPHAASISWHAALVLGDAGHAAAKLDRTPGAADAEGGPRGWKPIHYVCHTSVARGFTEREEGLAAIARRLTALGVDPNTRFPWPHHGVHRPILWGAAMVVSAAVLVRALLEAGADPNDGVTLPMAASAGNVPLLDLLHAFGGSADQPWASDGSPTLTAILAWSRVPDGPLWLLAHGADPNAVSPANGETALHAAARSWDAALIEALVDRGANIHSRRSDGRSPYAVAAVSGNREAADWLASHGADSNIAAVDGMAAACARGDVDAARAILRRDPDLADRLDDDHYIGFFRAAERGDVPVLAAMLACGFDPNRPDDGIGKTALHAAAMAGSVEAVRALLDRGASVEARDREFHATPLIWAAEAVRSGNDAGGRHAEVGRMLIEAGSPTRWETGAEPAERILEIVAEWVASSRA